MSRASGPWCFVSITDCGSCLGPDSEGVITLCRERGIVAVLGNHDKCVLDYYNDEVPEQYRKEDRWVKRSSQVDTGRPQSLTVSAVFVCEQ